MGGSTQTKSGPRSSAVSNAVLAKKQKTIKTQDIASSRPPRRLAALEQSENLRSCWVSRKLGTEARQPIIPRLMTTMRMKMRWLEVVGKEEDDSGESGEEDDPVVKKGHEGGAHRIKGGGSTARAAVCEDPRAVGQLVAGPALEAALSKTQKPASLG